ncbi:MAG: hypothetical protein ABXS91_10010 [Sulfurimonas sp.]
MSSSELMEWIEYFGIEPFPADRNEIQIAMLSSLISASNGGKAKMNDFILSGKQKVATSIEDASADDIDKLLEG